MFEKTEIIRVARGEGRIVLTEVESKQIISGEGVEVVETRLATSKKEAVSIAREMGFPVALKVVSTQIVHKSDSGGVRLGLNNVAEVMRAYSEVVASVGQSGSREDLKGVSIQKMVPGGVEVIMGMSKDAQFGPALMFGIGGVFVEVLEDVSFRIVPIVRRDAEEMVEEIKGYPVLQGYRGQKAADIVSLQDTLLKLSDLVERTPAVKEFDLNPVFACPDGAIVADARIILEPLDN